MSHTEDDSWEPGYTPDEQNEEYYDEKQELINQLADWLRASYRADRDAGADKVIYSDRDGDVEIDIQYPVGREVYKRRRSLENLSLDEIREIHNEKKNELRDSPAQQKALDKEQFFTFIDIDGLADPDYWSQKEFWSLEEALALSFGMNPEVINEATLAMYKYKDVSFFVKEWTRRRDSISRAKKWRRLSDPVSPGKFLAWAQLRELEVPANLLEKVKARGGRIDDWKAWFEALDIQCDEEQRAKEQQIAELTQQRDALREQIKEMESRLASDPPLREKERESLLKMLWGMAIDKYGYVPGADRNHATGSNKGSVAAAVENLGLSIDADTARKYLHEADARFGKNIRRP